MRKVSNNNRPIHQYHSNNNCYDPSRFSTTISTRWNSQSIDPAWHMIAACENILSQKIINSKKDIFKTIIRYGIQKKKNNNNELNLFINHCATMIQSAFKGYKERKYYRKFLPFYRRFRSLLGAVVSGWRVRRVMKLNCMLKRKNQIKNFDSSDYKEEKKKRIAIREFIYEISQLQKRGSWVSVFKKQPKIKKKEKNGKITIKNMLFSKEVKNEGNKTSRKQISFFAEKDTVRVEKKMPQIQIQVEKVNPFEEVPIKSSGQYHIETEELEKQPQITKRNKKIIKRKVVPKVKEQIPQDSQKVKTKPQQQQTKDEKKQEKVNKSILDLSINLIVEEERLCQSQKQDLLKTLKFGKKSMNMGQSMRMQKSESCRLKPKQRKGISITMGKNYEIPNSRKVQREENMQELNQIVSVYNSTYSYKRNELRGQMEKMKTQNNFSKFH